MESTRKKSNINFIDIKSIKDIHFKDDFYSNIQTSYKSFDFDNFEKNISSLIESVSIQSHDFTNSFKYQISELEKLKSLNYIELRKLRSSLNDFSSSSPSYVLKKIQNLSLDELIDLHHSIDYNSKNEDLRKFLEYYINKKYQTDWILKFIKNIDKTIKFIKSKINKLRRNKRFFFRKIQGFLFKNLDDYHSLYIIKNLQILILNNINNETKYFIKNRRSVSF